MITKEATCKLEEIEGIELKEELKDSYIVFNTKTSKKYKVAKETLNKVNLKNIEDVLNGRDPIIVDGITRIVGYFSRISNWNKSKLGELIDRRKGNYTV